MYHKKEDNMRQYLKIPDILDGEDKEEKHKINRIYIYKKL